MITGSIPKEIVIIYGDTKVIKPVWDDFEQENDSYKPMTVTPAFVSDAENAKTIATGESWAAGYKGSEKVKKTHKSNVPFTGLRIASLEHRCQGGRAYKVVDADGFYYDFREDVLLDAMIESSIEKGYIKGEFIWARVGSQMKLIRLGSALYYQVADANNRRKIKPISAKAFVPGGVYVSKNGSRSIYLGRVNTLKFSKDWTQDKISQVEKITNKMMWVRINDYSKLTPLEYLNEISNHYYSVSFKSNMAVVECSEVLDLPMNLFIDIQTQTLKNVEQVINDSAAFNTTTFKRCPSEAFCNYSELLHLKHAPTKPEPINEIIPYLTKQVLDDCK